MLSFQSVMQAHVVEMIYIEKSLSKALLTWGINVH